MAGKIQEVREKLQKTKLKIKDLKQRSREMGGTLENGHDYFEETKKLEQERDGYCARQNKLQEKVFHSENNLAKLIEKLS